LKCNLCRYSTGVMLTHDIVGKHAVATCAEMRIDGCDVWAHVAPMFHLVDAFAVYSAGTAVRCESS
jgi:hypothetical protein